MLKIKTKKQGAELTSIQYNGKEILFDGKTFWNRQSPILFPIVGQIKDSKTEIEGVMYEMSQHGFARDMEFDRITEDHYVLTYNEETLKKYPYKFELHVTYQTMEDTLQVEYKVKNIDNKKIYFGLGGHPAFRCDYTTGQYEIVFEEKEDKIEFLKLKNGLVDTQKEKNILENNKIHLTENIFDNHAIIMKNIKSNKVILQNIKTKQKILEFDFTDFPYLALWSKKGAPFVCIEPWQNTADKIDSNQVFKDKENINQLEPNEIFSCKYNIKFF